MPHPTNTSGATEPFPCGQRFARLCPAAVEVHDVVTGQLRYLAHGCGSGLPLGPQPNIRQ